MMYYEFKVGDREYKLRLNTRNVITLEKSLGCHPMMIFGAGESVPTETQMIYILHTALQPYEHGISLEDTYNIFDKWLEDGHTSIEFIKVILEIYKISGIIPKENEEEKN